MQKVTRQSLLEFIFKYRYAIALMVIIVGVALSLNGSSIGIWSNYIGQSELDNVLLGTSRAIRSDEWATFTPLAFSQAAQDVAFPYFNESVRATATDMFIVYGQPVLHFGAIFRPAHMGYLLFGLERGLSFFWVFRTVWLFMSVFELGLIIAKQNRKLACLLAVLMTFSPVVQWWFAVNGLVEMLSTSSMAVVLFYHYFKTTHYTTRLYLALALAWCGGVYILTFYPAWQVPVAYVMIALIVFVIWDNLKNAVWSWKKDTAILLGAFILMLVSVGVVLWQSKDTLSAVLNTDYPGKRVETGGHWGHILFDSPFSIFYTLTGLSWERGMDVMYDCLPLTLVLSAYVWKKTKDKLLIILAVLNAFFWVYITFGFPEILAKATLLSYSFGVRVVAPFGIVAIMMLIRSLALEWQLNRDEVKWYSALVASVAIVLALILHHDYFDLSAFGVEHSLQMLFMLIAALIAFVVLYVIYSFVLHRKISHLFISLSLTSLFFGAMVNPVRQGTRVIDDNALIKTMKQIHKEQPGVWVVDDLMYPYSNIPLLAGVPSVNVTNVYPNVDRWAQFDPLSMYRPIYNRYAHIHLKIDDSIDQVGFNLTLPDSFTAVMNTTHLRKMNVRYVLTQRQLSELVQNKASVRLKGNVNGFSIYELID
ncbi:hypothetical protein J7S27_00895 [Carnobacteriaceae bacterium zg-C25]|nr:hypothetical protein J7S27_00895 [Carnobacteriaceae bacterium zg-C25]